MTAVDEDGELDPRGPAVVEQRVDRGADRPARVEHVVDEHAGHALEREVQTGAVHHRLGGARRFAGPHDDVVAMERDVERPKGQGDAAALLHECAQPLRERDAARVDADERDGAEIRVPLDQLVRDARERAADGLVVEQRDGRAAARWHLAHAAPFRPHWTGLKGRRAL